MTQNTQNDAKNAKLGLKNAKYAKFGLKNAKFGPKNRKISPTVCYQTGDSTFFTESLLDSVVISAHILLYIFHQHG